MPIEHTSPLEDQQSSVMPQASPDEIKHTQESQDAGNKLHKINTILWVFDFPDEQEDSYSRILKKLDRGQLWALQKLDKAQFQELLAKPQIEIQQFLIQAQIDELKTKGLRNLTKPERKEFATLKKQFIALENQKQEKQQETIAAERSETSEIQNTIADNKQEIQESLALLKQEQASIRSALQTLNIQGDEKYSLIQQEFDRYDSVMQNYEESILKDNEREKLEDILSWINERVLEIIKSPWTLETIVQDLGWEDSEAFKKFESKMLSIDSSPSMRNAFDRVKAGFAYTLAKVKLWTDNLNWVDTSKDILVKQEWDLTIEAWKTGRNLSLEWSKYKLPSRLDSKYENEIESLHQQSSKELAPFNSELSNLANAINLINTLKTNGVRFDEAKTHLQQKHPETYNSLGLSSKSSYWEISSAIHAQIAQVEESKKKKTEKTKQKLKNIVAQSKKEAQEKDKAVADMLRFFNSIGLDDINQNTFTQIIDTVNLYPASYGLQQPIDLENGSIGFNLDVWNKQLSLLEKQAFIAFVNKMLWENVINRDIATGTTTLHPQERQRIKKLNNNTIGFFLTNLKRHEI